MELWCATSIIVGCVQFQLVVKNRKVAVMVIDERRWWSCNGDVDSDVANDSVLKNEGVQNLVKDTFQQFKRGCGR